MTAIEEMAGWLREESLKHRRNAHFAPDIYAKEVENEKANLWEARSAQVEAMGWRLIEECPKNGTYIDLWDSSAKKRLTDCRWDGNNRWIRWDENAFGVMAWCVVKGKITHFMPPPQPPVKK